MSSIRQAKSVTEIREDISTTNERFEEKWIQLQSTSETVDCILQTIESDEKVE
jgi:hypothetical protein